MLEKGKAPTNVKRYYEFLCSQEVFQFVQGQIPKALARASPEKKVDSSVSKQRILTMLSKMVITILVPVHGNVIFL